MLTPIGEMREPVAVLTPTQTVDESGGEDVTYTQGDMIFMAIRPASAKEANQFDQINAEVTHIAFGHYYDLYQLTADMKIRNLDTGIEYELTGPPMNDPGRGHTRLNLVQRENG